MKREDIFDIIRGVVGTVLFVGMFAITFIGVRECSTEYDTYQQNRPTYHVSYGNFVNRDGNDFETYKVDGNHYTFYGKTGELVADILVSGNNQISIYKNQKR